MKNMVPCKLCLKNFEYIPGPAGNARQLCDTCKSSVDEEELQRLEEETVIEGNRYLLDAPKRKPEFDPAAILLDGEFPELNTDGDRFVCVMELAEFVKNNGFGGNEDNVLDFLIHMDSRVHGVLFETTIGPFLQERLVNRAFERESN